MAPESELSDDPAALWPTAAWSASRFEEAMKGNPSLRYSIGLDQRLGRQAYIAGLLTAVVSLFLVIVSLVRPRALRIRAINALLSLTCSGVLLFILVDFCFYFVSPRWKLAFLGVYLVGSVILVLSSGLSKKRDTGDRYERLNFIMKSLWMPVALCSVLILLTLGALLGYELGKGFLDEKQFGVRAGAGFVLEVFANNFGFGILTMLIGLNLIRLGLRQLKRKESAA